MTNTLKILAAVLAFSVVTPNALAEKRNRGATFATVEYGDLDISKDAGAQKLLSRISQASKKICGKRPMTVMGDALERHLKCRAEVVKETVQRINRTNVTIAWQASTGGVIQTASR